MATNYIGCSGFSSRNWKDNFYRDIPSSRWLRHYSSVFNSVEINSSFYKLPLAKTLEKWRNETPDGFTFSMKAPRLITHFRKFENVADEVSGFYSLVSTLQHKLGAVLFQLPGSIAYSEELLKIITDTLNPEFINAVEFRNISWWNDNVFEAFSKKKLVFCNVSMRNLPDTVTPTTEISYTRLHGKKVMFTSSYTDEELGDWAAQLNAHAFRTSFVYFNNTARTAAIENALAIRNLLT